MAEEDTEKQRGEIIARAWEDPEYKKRLLSNPKEALKEMGVEVPEGVNLTVLESSMKQSYLVLPPEPTEELSEEELEMVAGGMGAPCCAPCRGVAIDRVLSQRLATSSLQTSFRNFLERGFLKF